MIWTDQHFPVDTGPTRWLLLSHEKNFQFYKSSFNFPISPWPDLLQSRFVGQKNSRVGGKKSRCDHEVDHGVSAQAARGLNAEGRRRRGQLGKFV